MVGGCLLHNLQIVDHTFPIHFCVEDNDLHARFQTFEIEFFRHTIGLTVVQRDTETVRVDLADRAFHVDALGEAVDRHQEVGGGQKGGNHHTHRSSFRGFA